MTYVEAPKPLPEDRSGKILFLAGGISNCPNWQRDMAEMLTWTKLIVVNPRRRDFGASTAAAQIKWEHRMLVEADGILFWFPEDTLCPITLYELGAWSMTKKPLFVGMHHGYKRKLDVEVQTALVRPEVRIATSFASLYNDVVAWVDK